MITIPLHWWYIPLGLFLLGFIATWLAGICKPFSKSSIVYFFSAFACWGVAVASLIIGLLI